jgi:hypothetical protein
MASGLAALMRQICDLPACTPHSQAAPVEANPAALSRITSFDAGSEHF